MTEKEFKLENQEAKEKYFKKHYKGEKEFNLSEKRFYGYGWRYLEKDIKEFIKICEESSHKEDVGDRRVIAIEDLKKLAGPKLITK